MTTTPHLIAERIPPHDLYIIDLSSEIEKYRNYPYRETLHVARNHNGSGLEGIPPIAARLGVKTVYVPWRDIDTYVNESGWTINDHRVYDTPWWNAMNASPLIAIFDPPENRPDLIERFERFVDSEGTTLVAIAVDYMPDGRYASRSGLYRYCDISSNRSKMIRKGNAGAISITSSTK